MGYQSWPINLALGRVNIISLSFSQKYYHEKEKCSRRTHSGRKHLAGSIKIKTPVMELAEKG